MMLKTLNGNKLTFAFEIPHVSKLLIYKDNWNKSQVMRKVIEQVLHAGLFNKIYIGKNTVDFCNTYDQSRDDCAIINIEMSGIQNLTDTPKTVEELFAREINTPANAIQFNNTRLDIVHNVTCIDISIFVVRQVIEKNDIQAA